MKKIILKIFTVVFVLSFMASPVIAQMITARAQSAPPPEFEPLAHPEPQPVPQEILDMFEGGMTIEEFLAINQGPIPNAILEFADIPVTVVVQLDKPPLIEYVNQEGLARSNTERQSDYVAQLKQDQAAVLAQIAPSRGGEVVQIGDVFTKTLNGFMLRVPAYAIKEIRAIPGVKAVTQAPEYELDLKASIPLIGASDVWTNMEVTGEGITIAVIDTGIDYTHEMLGGSGDPADYALNDPTIITDIAFPTAKVIGGYDFAGSNYDASGTYGSPMPVPDPDPLDENGHGTHVASTAAGESATIGDGVAPDAKLYALKIFGVQGSTNLALHAIEWAMDPEGLGHLAEPVDVINMSIGSDWGPADVNDPQYQAVENATSIGVVVVSSAGNNGDSAYTTGSPASADSAISVAASSTGYETLPYFLYDTTQRIYFTPGNRFDVAITADLFDVNDLAPEPGGLMCNADVADITGTPLDGKIALISRGTCNFSEKINNAEALGAKAVFIYNNQPGSFGMDTGDSTLPAGSISQEDGNLLLPLTPLEILVDPDNVQMRLAADLADTLADFSSRGPRGFDSMLKPEITAPGVSIFAADMGSGDKGVSYSGTSMASPHIAGVAALLAEAHPGWDPVHIKAAMMNTADDLYDPSGGVVPLQGAGRVDAFKAARTKVVAYADPKLVSLSWGVIEIKEDNSYTKTITLRNFSGFDIEFDISTLFTSDDSGATLTPAVPSVIVPAEGVASVDVTLVLTAADLPIWFGPFEHEEYYGFVTFTAGADTLRVPFYFVPRPYTEITELDAYTRFEAEDEMGLLLLEQSGPVDSSMDAYPVSLISPENPDVLDHGDLRYVGMDYMDPFIFPAFAMWDDVHNPLPYFNEIDLYIDADRDGVPETVNFNWNYYPFGFPDDNWWLVVQVDFTDGKLYAGSPYLTYADFNTGVQVWALPPSWNYITDTFDYYVFSYDYYMNQDFGGMSSFDITRPPLLLGFNDWSPGNGMFAHGIWINDWYGYSFSNTQGVMLLDYHGRPGMGQSYYWPIEVYFDYFYPVFGQ